MSKRASLISYDHPASAEDRERLLRAARFMLNRLYYNRHGKTWECRCTKCGREYEASDEIMRQIKNAGKCFHCGNDVKTVIGRATKKESDWKREWIAMCNEKGCLNGYEVCWKTENGVPKLIRADHVLHQENGATYLYGIVKTMGYSITRPWDESKYAWRKERKSYIPYLNYFSSLEEIEQDMNRTRKEMYLDTVDLKAFKSNQITFIKKGIYNENQLEYIRAFDLNYPEDLIRFEKYIKIHRCNVDHDDKFNVNVLKYLNDTHQSISAFREYVRACHRLGIKPGKPKNLDDAEAELMEKIRLIDDAQRNEQIIARHEELKPKEYKKGGFAVHVFVDIHDMQKIGETLHNCIGKMYVEPYAEKRTDVYFGTKNGKVTFAFEINKNRLVQLRTFNNANVDDETSSFVKGWCKRYGYAC